MRGEKNSKGQASIMIAMMTVTFVFFFTFAVSTGILVSAKINLQNAADMAAYAGASVQARQLNEISFLNYEMRRQYKKFLYRYYVLGTKAYAPEKHPGGQRYWSLSGDPATAFGVPSVCITFNTKSNHCQVAQLLPIQPPPVNPLDSISQALATQLTELEQIREQQCGYSWFTNQILLVLWLFNTDPALADVKAALAAAPNTPQNADTRLVLDTVLNLSQGLGLIPREILLQQRMQTLASYINTIAANGVGFSQVQGMKTAGDPSANERTIQAFLSAYYTLGSGEPNDTFPAGSIQMTELLPTGGTSGSSLIELDTIKTSFEAYYTYFLVANGLAGVTNGTCLPRPVPYRIAGVPVGVSKNPGLLTYYAVRMDAAANLFFRSTMFPGLLNLHLKAYSAAQPFGSRIGPVLSDADWRKNGAGPKGGSFFSCGGPDCFGPPNLQLENPESVAAGGSGDYWDTQVITAFQDDITVNAGQIQLNDDNYYNGMAPNPPEIGKYNILNDYPETGDTNTTGNPMMKFLPNQISESSTGDPDYSFRAPIVPSGLPPDEAQSLIAQMVNDSLQSITSDGAAGDARISSLKSTLLTNINSYMTKMANGQGEGNEGNYIARLRSPFRGIQNAGGGWTVVNGVPGVNIPQSQALQAYNNSWITQKNTGIQSSGRLGYSVKFVSFQTLLSGGGGATTNGTQNWTNGTPSTDSDTITDLGFLKH